MCGICGLVGFAPGASVDAMRDALAHRGPDATGSWADATAALGFRRLAILDVEGGGQPMTDEAGRFRLVLNGEIYNHRELRRELESKGHRFTSRCDTEVVVHLFEEEGEACVSRLRGMFA